MSNKIKIPRNPRIAYACFIMLFITSSLAAQERSSYWNHYPEGISINCGLGYYSVKDEYISKEKYSGRLPYYSVRWARNHDKYLYRLDMSFRNSNNIKNYNVSTKITQFTLNQGFLYPLKEMSMFKKDLSMWFGPSTELFIYGNDQNIAVSGFDYAQSFAGLFSLGINAEVMYPLIHNFQLEPSLSITVLSLGFRMIDSEEDNQSPVKPLILFSGLNASFDLNARFYLFNRLSVKIAYRFDLTRVSVWNPYLSASDNLIIGLTFNFKKESEI